MCRNISRNSVVRLTIALALGACVLAPPPVSGQSRKNTRTPKEATFREHHTWGIFLGLGATPEERRQVEDSIRHGKWLNPFTGKPFEDAKVFAFGHTNPASDRVRVVGDHLQIPALSSWSALEGLHVDFVICHSNGCPNALGAHAEGVMRAEHFLALGTDWTSKDFRPGELKGADVTFFVLPGDPVWRIPAPSWTRVAEDAPGLAITIPFDRLKDIPKGLVNLATQGRADPDRYPVVHLSPPRGQGPTLAQPFRAHFLEDSYSPAIRMWLDQGGEIQTKVNEQIRRAGRHPNGDEERKPGFLPPGGGGPWGGGRGGSNPASPGQGASRNAVSPPGGVSAEIAIDPRDIAPVRDAARRPQEATKKP